jgi:hypothetical protein
LGGHSLLITQVASRISAAFGMQITLRTLFDSPTVSQTTSAIADICLQQEPDLANTLEEVRELSTNQIGQLLRAELYQN